MKKRFQINVLLITIIIISIISLSSCFKKTDETYKKNPLLDTKKTVELRLAMNTETWLEMDKVISQFIEIYPNCSIVCEYIENYTDSIDLRLSQNEQKIDILKTTNIQNTTKYKDKVLNLISEDAKKYLNLNDTNDGLVKNFKYIGEDNIQYAIPYGGEMRGLYVNVTLLEKYNLEVPTNRSELLNCCKVLKENGYIPFHSGVGTFGQQLLYPYICNIIVNSGNYEEMYQSVENIDAGISEYFRDVFAFLYEIIEKGYYDSLESNRLGFLFSNNYVKAYDFLNIKKSSDESYIKIDDIGQIAFMPDTQAFDQFLTKTKADYHSSIEYKFIASPVGIDGGYAYLSPSDGLAINKNSDNVEWSLEFLNFFFTKKIATEFAIESNKIPNTKDGVLKYNIPNNRTCDVGQVTFSYKFYQTITPLLMGGYSDFVGISKMNNPGQMVEKDDGSLGFKYNIDDYITRLEEEFQKVKDKQANK